MTYQVIKKKLL